jgi:hypothetical protein
MSKKILSILFISIGFLLINFMISNDARVIDLHSVEKLETIEKIEHTVQNQEISDISSDYTKKAVFFNSRITPTRPTDDNTGYGSAMGSYISVSGRNIPVIDVSSTALDAGDHVNKFGDRFYYGHNSGNVFGGLVNYGVGTSFSINSNGITHNYRVVKAVVYEKNAELGRLQLNGSGSYMKAVSQARSDGVQYSIALMTCYGTPYGNGGATHRLVLFANEF